jgi:Na+/melibiose symporter-like transporter
MGRADLARLGAMGFPLAFVALPLYVVLPHHYANTYALPLSWIGALLLATRLGDAFIDPWLGRCTDRWFAQSHTRVLAWARACGVLLSGGLVLLFFPHGVLPVPASPWGLMGVASLALVACCVGLSTMSLAHQSWGARLGGNEAQRSRLVGWREGLGLLGVICASVLSAAAGVGAMVAAFALALVVALWAWHHAPAPTPTSGATTAHAKATPDAQSPPSTAPTLTPMRMGAPLQQPLFRGLLAVFVLNGIASAIPATLVLFFVQDRLQAAPGQEGIFLAIYFCAAAVSMPLWLRAVQRLGLVRCWLLGMGLAMGVFIWTLGLGTGDTWAFGWVCALSGLALGVDVIAPGALLTGVVQRLGQSQSHQGLYWGWWQVATKLNLALAAGLTLPALQWWGYTPGQHDAAGLWTLSCAYGLIPCLLKAAAALCLWLHRHSLTPSTPTETPP